MIDLHTHILPNMDDGSISPKQSLEMLTMLEKQNVKLVCLTSHFYANTEPIDEYIKRRNDAFNQINYEGNIELKLGCEVHYYRGISVSDEIGKLCIEGTNLLLIELPFETRINENIINEVLSIKNRGYKVVLAHFERYNFSTNDLKLFKSNGILLQANCEFIIGSLFNTNGIKLLKDGYIDFLGSDCHDSASRKPNYSKAVTKIQKKLGDGYLNNFNDNCYKIINEAKAL